MKRSVFCIFTILLTSFLSAQTVNPTAPANPSPPLIILIGPPLSGKTTFADAISRTYEIPSISIEDLIREHAAELQGLRGEGVSLAEMRYDPAMSRYMRERLKKTELSRGITLDGYPATLVQAEDLAKVLPDLKLTLIALRLQLPDETIRERAKTTGRQSDSPEIIEQRIKNYHREMDAISFYFPNAKIADIDDRLAEAEVWKAIRTALDQAGLRSKPDQRSENMGPRISTTKYLRANLLKQ